MIFITISATPDDGIPRAEEDGQEKVSTKLTCYRDRRRPHETHYVGENGGNCNIFHIHAHYVEHVLY